MNELPAPLVPAEVDLRGLEYMPLFGVHLFGSEFNARADDAAWRAAVTLWWAAWTQTPAASLPNDDVALCRLADMGRDVKAWRKVKVIALHGFVLCADGRLYHKFLAREALVAWDKRVQERARKAAWRAQRQAEKRAAQNQGQGPGQDADGDGDTTGTVPVSETGTRRGQSPGQDSPVPASGCSPVPSDGNRRDGNRRDGTLKDLDPYRDRSLRPRTVSNQRVNGKKGPPATSYERFNAHFGRSVEGNSDAEPSPIAAAESVSDDRSAVGKVRKAIREREAARRARGE